VAEDVELLTYDEIAERFGITRESARQLVLRKHWARRKGNDGRARIEVPLDALPSSAPSPAPSESTGDDTSDAQDVARVLNRHIERLEQTLAAAIEKAEDLAVERDTARAEARGMERERDAVKEEGRALESQIESLRALMEAEARLRDLEKEAANEARADRDQWRALASRPWWKRLVG